MKKSLLLLVVAIFTLTTAFDASAKWTDRNTFNLKGPVKAVYENGSTDIFSEFDYDGTLSELNNGSTDWEISRDRKGRLIEFSVIGQGYHFTYNTNGQLIKLKIWAGAGTDFTRTFTYNSKGQVIKRNWDGDVTTYTYQKFDKYGNWIKRTAKTGRKSTIETRTITYYE